MAQQPIVHNHKRGLGWPWNNTAEEFHIYDHAIADGRLTWLFNWEMWKPNGTPERLEYVPQVRTASEIDQVDPELSTLHNTHQLHGFMGFNEPDNTSQANLPVAKAVSLWKQHVLPLKEKEHWQYAQGSPAISNGPNGLPWLEQFVKELGGLEAAKIDVIVIHCYTLDVQELKDHVQKVHQKFNKPIWLTEFACTAFDAASPPSEAHVTNFMKEALKFLDETAFVEKYAWFGAMKTLPDNVGKANSLQHDGNLSEAGKIYCA